MKPLVVIVNFEYPPIAGPGVWRVLALSRDLDTLGFEVSVVCSDRSAWHALSDATLLARIPPTVRVARVHAPLLADWSADLKARAARSRSRLGRAAYERLRHWLVRYVPDPAVAWAWRAAGEVRRQIAAARGRDVVIVTSGPAHVTQLVGLAARYGRPQRRLRWIMDYRDLWSSDPTHVYAGPYQSRLHAALERRCLRACDAVVSVAPAWLDDLGALMDPDPRARERLHVIRNGHDIDVDLARRLHAGARRTDRLHLHFSGTLQSGTRAAAAALFEALARLRHTHPELRPPRVTFTGMAPRLVPELGRLGLGDVVEDVGYRPQEEALALSAVADVLLVLVDTQGAGRHGIIPAKTYEGLALGRHLLAVVPAGSDVVTLLRDYGNATICAEDPAAIAEALATLVARHTADPQSLAVDEAQRARWLEACSRRAGAEAYAGLIRRLLAAGAVTGR